MQIEAVRVEQLREDDRVDLESCPYLRTYPSASLAYATVTSVEQETSDCLLVGYEGIDYVGYRPGTVLRRVRAPRIR